MTTHKPDWTLLLIDRDRCLAERDRLRFEREEVIEALSIIAGGQRQDDTYAGMESKQIARALLARLKP